MQALNGVFIANPSATVFNQQDHLLTSWLLSTISSSYFSSFTDVRLASDVWLTVTSLFAANTGSKQSRIRHELHSLKKGSLSIQGYVAKIKGLCALLEDSCSHILEAEKIEITFAGLPAEFDDVVSSASLSSTLFSF